MRSQFVLSTFTLLLSALAACSAKPESTAPRNEGGSSGETSSTAGSSSGGAPSGFSGSPSTGTAGTSTGTAGTSQGFAGAPPSGTAGAGTGTGGAPAAGAACGMGRKVPTSPIIDNFDGMTQVLEWDLANMTTPAGAKIMPTGMLSVMASNNGANGTYAAGLIAQWAAANRPCVDATQYTGIQFTVTGNTTDLLFRIATPATTPTADGGTCADTMCAYAHYQAVMTASLTAGGMAQAPFAMMAQPWANGSTFDKSALTEIVFLTTDTTAGHSFTVDNISFY